MITQEHCANTRQTWAKCGCFFLRAVFIYLDLPCPRAEPTWRVKPKYNVFFLFMTVIKLSKKLLSSVFRFTWPIYSLKWHVLNGCWKTFLRYMPTYSIKYFLFKVSIEFVWTSYPQFAHLFLVCGQEKMWYIIHAHKNTLVCSACAPLCFKTRIYMNCSLQFMLHSRWTTVYFTFSSLSFMPVRCMQFMKRALKCCHPVSADSSSLLRMF